MPLTDKEEKFCQEYVKKLDKAKAAVAAGYSKNSAKEIGYQTFTKIHIKERIAEIRQEIQEKLGIDEHSVLIELQSLAFWNIKDFVQEDNSLKDISKIGRTKAKPIAGIKVKETITTIGDVTTKEVTTELKLTDKRAALTDLGKHLGIFKEDNEQQAIKITIKRK